MKNYLKKVILLIGLVLLPLSGYALNPQDNEYPIYYITFPNQYLLGSTMIRFSEYSESPKFKGKIFTLEECMDYNALAQGKFNYFEIVGGTNFPSSVLKPFYDGKFNPVSKKEAVVINFFRNVKGDFYIIASFKGSSEELCQTHELIHALYYLFPSYREDVNHYLEKSNLVEVRDWLKGLGIYHPSVLLDETNAYLLEGDHSFPIMQTPKIEKAREALMQIYIRHFGHRLDSKEELNRLRSKIHPLVFNW